MSAPSISATIAGSWTFFACGRFGLPTRARSSFWTATISLMTRCALDEGLRHHLFRDLGGARLDHHDRVLGAGHEQVQLALRLEVGVRGVHDELPVPVADAHRADRALERDVRDVEGGRRADDRQRVGVVLHVRREQEADHLRLAGVALGEERPQRPVDHPGGQDLLLVRPALALEETAGDLAAGVVALAVVDRQGQEVEADARLALRAGGGEDDGVAQAHEDGAVGLLGHPPRLQGQGVAAQGQFQSFHALSLSATAGARPRGCREQRGAGLRAGRLW